MNQKLLGILTASFLIGAFLVSVSASFLQRSAETALDTRTVGEEVYTTYCASCHGEAGAGDGPAAYAFEMEGNTVTNFIPDISDQEEDKTFQYGLNAAGVPTDEALHETILYGRGGGAMPAFPLLSVSQREAVIAYIKTFRNGGWPSAADVEEAESATESATDADVDVSSDTEMDEADDLPAEDSDEDLDAETDLSEEDDPSTTDSADEDETTESGDGTSSDEETTSDSE